MTEDEAKTKYCCGPPSVMAAVMAHHKGSTIIPHEFCRCIGCACMAWRWNDNGSIESQRLRAKNGDGYCGLAGKP